MIEAYLADLRRELGGPLLLRAGMLREVRDGLNDAAQAYRAAGLSPHEAERAAVDEFGPADLVGGELRAELAASTGRYLGIVTFIGGTVLFALAQLSWQGAAAEQGWPEPTPAYAALADIVDIGAIVFVLVSGLGVLALGIGSRFLPERRVVRLLAYVLLGALVFQVVAGGVLSAFAPVQVGSETVLDMVMRAVYALVIAWFAALGRRCLWLTSPRRVSS